MVALAAVASVSGCPSRSGTDDDTRQTAATSAAPHSDTQGRVRPIDGWRISGCRQFETRPIPDCYTETGTVSVFVPAVRYALLEARVDGDPLADSAVDGGQRFVARRPGLLHIVDRDHHRALAVHIRAWPPPPPPAPTPTAPRRPSSVDDARARLHYCRSPRGAPEWLSKERCLRWLSNLDDYFGERGLRDEQASTRSVHASRLVRLGRLAEAYEVAWQPLLLDIPTYERELALHYVRVASAREVGALTDARFAFNAARPCMRASGDVRMNIHLRLLLLSVLPQLGEISEMERLVATLEALLPQARSRTQATVLVDLGWAAYLIEESCRHQLCAPMKLAASTEYTRRALSLMGEGHRHRDTALVNLAMASLVQGAQEDARRVLRQLQRSPPNPYLSPWITLIDAELAADEASMRARAIRSLKTLGSDTSVPPEVQWRAHVLRGTLAERSGDNQAAEQAYLDAEAVGRAWLGYLAVGAGTVGLRRSLDAASDRLVRLLLGQGRTADAFERARAARRTELTHWMLAASHRDRPAEERRRWHASAVKLRGALSGDDAEIAEALRQYRQETAPALGGLGDRRKSTSPPPGVARFMITSAGEQLHVFLELNARVHVQSLGPPLAASTPNQIVQAGLAAVAEQIDEAQEIWLLETAPTRGVSLTALRHPVWRQPLFLTHHLSISLDLPPAPATEGEPTAVVVIDTDRIEPARNALPAVLESMSASGLQPQVPPPSIGRDALVRRATRAEWFHFLGHGRVEGDAWRSGLQLPGGGWLQSADLFALDAAPEFAVLLACHSGGSIAASRPRPIGIAHALLIAGTQEVVGTRALLSARDAQSFQSALYAAPGRLRHRWTAAVRALHSTLPRSAERALTVFVR